MTDKLLFYVNRLDRKREFGATTSIYKSSGGRLFVVKKPASNHFPSHFNSIFEAPEKLEVLSMGPSPINIIKPTPMGNAVRFPFISGRSVERIMLEKVLADDQESVHQIIERFLTALDKLPSTKCMPVQNSQYRKIFGDAFKDRVECINPGIVDLNLDNIVEDNDGKWHLIDYEWTFDFPVPKDYIIGRLLLTFFILRYQDLIKGHAARIKQVEIGTGYSIPIYIADAYDNWIKLFPTILDTESHFQSYVLGTSEDLGSFNYIPESHREIVQPPMQFIDDYLDSKAKNIELKNAHHQLSTELHNIRNSRAHKVAFKVSKLKNKVKRRK